MSILLTSTLGAPSSAAAHPLRALLHTRDEVAPALARLALGLVILPHGAQKTLGWFGGYGFTGTMEWFTGTMHFPWAFGLAAILAETLGGLALLAGFASRVAALALGAVFATAVVTVHASHGFFMNWFGNQKGEGIEFFILGLALVAIVLVRGGGTASIDHALTRPAVVASPRAGVLPHGQPN